MYYFHISSYFNCHSLCHSFFLQCSKICHLFLYLSLSLIIVCSRSLVSFNTSYYHPPFEPPSHFPIHLSNSLYFLTHFVSPITSACCILAVLIDCHNRTYKSLNGAHKIIRCCLWDKGTMTETDQHSNNTSHTDQPHICPRIPCSQRCKYITYTHLKTYTIGHHSMTSDARSQTCIHLHLILIHPIWTLKYNLKY